MRLLKPGDNGIFVQYLSLALERAGFSTGGITDDFNSKVYNSLIAFQNSKSLRADGVVGEQTWNSLLPYIKGYIRVTAAEGQTLGSIADAYSADLDAVKTANPLVVNGAIAPGTVITVPFSFELVPTNVDYSYFLVSMITEGLAARYPFVKCESAGKSIMNNNIDCISIGSGNTEMFANASHHANEWITTPVLLKYAEDYCDAVSKGGIIEGVDAAGLYNSKALYIMPLVNPDGVDLVNGALSNDNEFYLNARSIAADYSFIPFPNGWKANIEGTDLNLNYPAGWQRAKQIKAEQGFVSPAPRDFVGTAPLSAVESRTVYNYTLSHDFALTLSYHTQGEVIYWKYLNYLPPRSEEIGIALSEASGYSLDTTPYASGFAGYKDWYISYYNRPGYTVEIGLGANPLPISDFDNVYPPNKRLITTALMLI